MAQHEGPPPRNGRRRRLPLLRRRRHDRRRAGSAQGRQVGDQKGGEGGHPRARTRPLRLGLNYQPKNSVYSFKFGQIQIGLRSLV